MGEHLQLHHGRGMHGQIRAGMRAIGGAASSGGDEEGGRGQMLCWLTTAMGGKKGLAWQQWRERERQGWRVGRERGGDAAMPR